MQQLEIADIDFTLRRGRYWPDRGSLKFAAYAQRDAAIRLRLPLLVYEPAYGGHHPVYRRLHLAKRDVRSGDGYARRTEKADHR